MMVRGVTLLLVAVLAGCSSWQQDRQASAEMDDSRFEPIVVRVSGFGTYAEAADRLDTRKRLLARRASQLDAYRNLAERVYGTVIFGSSTVNDFVLNGDNFRTYVDSYIRGAKMVAVNEHSDGVVETVMELKLEPRFRACVALVEEREVQSRCPVPMPTGNDSAGDVHSRSVDSLYYLD
ncbi:LPP20 family lipoprotein [Marinobacter zhejiangensis]|uniref:Lipoprotein LPP20-like domain-containing protein n=1 Tax=Marinobacter zhejiangensis TaxID=488535 RepID=A0A1I4TP55_9GAMM|nr:LPP20 family lipoprotein [Marinobacter zhejiangensis]SFM78512.1 hypothetical protein SAMN04487963_3696 [Marinobacter zhejiangensis]